MPFGVRNVVENKVDFTKTRNVIIAALILVLSIGIKYSAAGAISFTIGSLTISLSGLAVGALVGIVLNAILPDKDYVFDEEKLNEIMRAKGFEIEYDGWKEMPGPKSTIKQRITEGGKTRTVTIQQEETLQVPIIL